MGGQHLRGRQAAFPLEGNDDVRLLGDNLLDPLLDLAMVISSLVWIDTEVAEPVVGPSTKIPTSP